MLSFDVLKNRINEIYRSNAMLESYQNDLLRNSEFLPANEAVIEQAKSTTLALAREIIQTISTITNRDYNTNSFVQPLEIAHDLIKSEHFFATRELIDGLLAIYEKNFNDLVGKFMISPLDKLRFYKMQFV